MTWRRTACQWFFRVGSWPVSGRRDVVLDRRRRNAARHTQARPADLASDFDQPAGAATGSGRIYLLSPEVLGQPRTLQSVARESATHPTAR